MILRKKVKEHPLKGCALSLATLAGLVLICFIVCTVVFQLNQASTGGQGLTGFILPFIG